jgi:hypothetical protein
VHGEVALEAVQFRVVPVEVVPLAASPVGTLGADVQPEEVELPLPLPHEGRRTIPVMTSHNIRSAAQSPVLLEVRLPNVNPIRTNPETGIQINPYRSVARENRSRAQMVFRFPDDAVWTIAGEGPIVVKVNVAVAAAPLVIVTGLVLPNEHVGAVAPLTVGETLHDNATVPE